jgi:hypothetical protein
VRLLNVRASVYAGIAAAVVSTVAQVAMWIAFTDAFPAILWRDTGMAAAILLGSGALADAFGTATIWIAATFVHFLLSIVYALLLGLVIHRRRMPAALLAGVLFGAALYVVNMHAFTLLYPWFEQARDPITLAAHAVFGLTAAFVYRRVDARTPRRGA